MKLIAFVEESPNPKIDFIIVRFKYEKTSQHFQIFTETPYKKGIKKIIVLIFKILSPNTKKSYFN